MIREGSFRASLYHRLSACEIWIPPLRQRRDDIGRLLLLMQRVPEAGDYFRKSVGAKPDMAAAYYGLGLAFDAQGLLQEALEAYQRALALNIDYADAHFNLARVLSSLGRNNEALTQYEKALELRPGDTEARDQVNRLRALQQK